MVCSACEMPHHKDCWIENQGCTTFGCQGTIRGVDGQAYGQMMAEGARQSAAPHFTPSGSGGGGYAPRYGASYGQSAASYGGQPRSIPTGRAMRLAAELPRIPTGQAMRLAAELPQTHTGLPARRQGPIALGAARAMWQMQSFVLNAARSCLWLPPQKMHRRPSPASMPRGRMTQFKAKCGQCRPAI